MKVRHKVQLFSSELTFIVALTFLSSKLICQWHESAQTVAVSQIVPVTS